jgi:hypothetical protein
LEYTHFPSSFPSPFSFLSVGIRALSFFPPFSVFFPLQYMHFPSSFLHFPIFLSFHCTSRPFHMHACRSARFVVLYIILLHTHISCYLCMCFISQTILSKGFKA